MTYLQITLAIAPNDRPAAAAIYQKYKQVFLETIRGAKSKALLIREEDVQVLHGFEDATRAHAYLESPLFQKDVVSALAPLLEAAPQVRVYSEA